MARWRRLFNRERRDGSLESSRRFALIHTKKPDCGNSRAKDSAKIARAYTLNRKRNLKPSTKSGPIGKTLRPGRTPRERTRSVHREHRRRNMRAIGKLTVHSVIVAIDRIATWTGR